MAMGKDYHSARREMDALVRDFPALRKHTVVVGMDWERAVAKDSEGTQALNYVRDLRERIESGRVRL